MFEKVLAWLKENEGRIFQSPRRRAQNFKIVNIEEKRKRVKIRFLESKYPALPLTFWMFDRTLQYLNKNKGRFIRLGAKLQPPYGKDTIEGIIWRKPNPEGKTPYKASSHVCDILALAGIAEYGYAINPSTNRKVQAVRIQKVSKELDVSSFPSQPVISQIKGKKEDFLEKFKEVIINWAKKNEDALIEGRSNYSWKNKSLLESVDERNGISQLIVLSRIKNGGGIDLETANKIMSWGG